MPDSVVTNNMKNKWLILIGGGLLIFVFIIVILMPSGSRQEDILPPSAPEIQQQYPQTGLDYSSQAPTNPTPTVSVEMQRAIDEAKQSAQQYDNWQANLRIEYPWLRKFPIAAGNYFVYFDLKKQTFIGKLYLKSSDNAEQMKAALIKYMIEVKEIPANSYPFEWFVFPQ